MSEKLLNCPFCGQDAITKEIEDWPSCGSPTTYYSVGCKNEDCHGCLDIDLLYKSEDKAVLAWNKRI